MSISSSVCQSLFLHVREKVEAGEELTVNEPKQSDKEEEDEEEEEEVIRIVVLYSMLLMIFTFYVYAQKIDNVQYL